MHGENYCEDKKEDEFEDWGAFDGVGFVADENNNQENPSTAIDPFHSHENQNKTGTTTNSYSQILLDLRKELSEIVVDLPKEILQRKETDIPNDYLSCFEGQIRLEELINDIDNQIKVRKLS